MDAPLRAAHPRRTSPYLSPPKELTVAAAHWLRYARLAYFSSPKSARQLYRLVKRQQVRRIFEVGISDVARSEALIAVAQRYAGSEERRRIRGVRDLVFHRDRVCLISVRLHVTMETSEADGVPDRRAQELANSRWSSSHQRAERDAADVLELGSEAMFDAADPITVRRHYPQRVLARQ